MDFYAVISILNVKVLSGSGSGIWDGISKYLLYLTSEIKEPKRTHNSVFLKKVFFVPDNLVSWCFDMTCLSFV